MRRTYGPAIRGPPTKGLSKRVNVEADYIGRLGRELGIVAFAPGLPRNLRSMWTNVSGGSRITKVGMSAMRS
jgi:hypothetical protein